MSDKNFTPLPKFKKEVEVSEKLTFIEAMKQIILGKRVTRIDWNDNNCYCLIKSDLLMIYIEDEYKTWTISIGDIFAQDWVVLPNIN